MEGAGFGVTMIDCKLADVTVRGTVGDVTPPEAAVNMAVPGATAVTLPVESTIANLVSLEFHPAELVRFAALPSE